MKVNKTLAQVQDLKIAMLCTLFTYAMSRRQKQFVSCLSLKDVSMIMFCFTKRLVPANLLDLQI